MTDIEIEEIRASLRCVNRLRSLRKRVLENCTPTYTASRGTLEKALADLIRGIGGETAIIRDHLERIITKLY